MNHLSNSQKAAAIQNSIETNTLLETGLLHPTRYKQHNPNVATGRQAILDLHAQMPHEKIYTNVVRAFQDGDYGFVHVDYHLFEPTVAFDIHRFEDGISVEHWDNLQPTPKERNPSGRTMTDGKTKATDHHKTTANKEIITRFTEDILIQQHWKDIHTYFSNDRLIQHNPYLSDGVAAYVTAMQEWKANGQSLEYKQLHLVLGEGNFVLALSEAYWQGNHTAIYDLYRIEENKIVEHWDVFETIPPVEARKNTNSKF